MILADSCHQLGLRRIPRLVETGRVGSPAVMGLWRPALLLPEGAPTRFTPEELRLIFLHELAHLRRGDHLVQCLIAVMHCLHWFNPVLAWAFHRMRLDREPATDALVLSRTGTAHRESYGLALLKVLENYQTRHTVPLLVGILEDPSQLKKRFRLISLFTPKSYAWSMLGVLLVSLLVGFGLTQSPTHAESGKQGFPASAQPQRAIPALREHGHPDLIRTLQSIELNEFTVDALSMNDFAKSLQQACKTASPEATNANFLVHSKKEPKATISGSWRNASPLKVLRDLKRQGLLDYKIEEFAVFLVPLPDTVRTWMASMKATKIDFDIKDLPADQALNKLVDLIQAKGLNLKMDTALPASWIRPISLSFKDMPAEDVLGFICRLSGLHQNIVIAPDGSPVIQFFKADSSQNDAGDFILTDSNLRFTEEVAVPAGMLPREAGAADGSEALGSFFEKNGVRLIPPSSVIYSPKTGMLSVRGTPAEIEKVRAVVKDWMGRRAPKEAVPTSQSELKFNDADRGMGSGSKVNEVPGAAQESVRLVKAYTVDAGRFRLEYVSEHGVVDVADQLAEKGVELTRGSSAGYVVKTQKLVVKATPAEMAQVEAVLIEGTPPAEVIQVEIQVAMFEHTPEKEQALKQLWESGRTQDMAAQAPELRWFIAPRIVVNNNTQGTVYDWLHPYDRTNGNPGVNISLALQPRVEGSSLRLEAAFAVSEMRGHVGTVRLPDDARTARMRDTHSRRYAPFYRFNERMKALVLEPGRAMVLSSGWSSDDLNFEGDGPSRTAYLLQVKARPLDSGGNPVALAQ